jgi:hypothetical protein
MPLIKNDSMKTLNCALAIVCSDLVFQPDFRNEFCLQLERPPSDTAQLYIAELPAEKEFSGPVVVAFSGIQSFGPSHFNLNSETGETPILLMKVLCAGST